MTIAYPRLNTRIMTGEELLKGAENIPCASVLDFWRWQGSNLLDNALRGILAEFLVALALDRTNTPRVEWDDCDCRTKEGVRVEVKSSAYIQSWDQNTLSRLSFNIAPKRALDKQTNTYRGKPGRHSDVYVFCVYTHRDQATINPLDLSQWEFHVLPTKTLNTQAPTQKTITLSSLINRFNPANPPYSHLRQAIQTAAHS